VANEFDNVCRRLNPRNVRDGTGFLGARFGDG
jgi:hypothetical protein